MTPMVLVVGKQKLPAQTSGEFCCGARERRQDLLGIHFNIAQHGFGFSLTFTFKVVMRL